MHLALAIDEHSASPAGAAARRTVRTAYLLSRYPAISHTFFLREVLGLRRLGMHIETASINPPDRPIEKLNTHEAAEATSTYYIKSREALVRLLATCLEHPIVLARGLGAVLRAPRLPLRQRAFWLLYLAEALLVGAWMRKRGLAHLHVHFGGAVATVGMLAAQAWRLPWSLTIHGPEELLNTDAYHLSEKISSATTVFCISDFCRSQLCRLLPPAHWNRLHVLRLGVDVAGLHPRAFTPARTRLQLVCTGRLVPEKGHHILLQALKLLHSRGLALETTLIGSGPELDGLEAYAAQNGLLREVRFAGALPHEETLALVRDADIFALGSFAEGIPVALMEAMALAIPCVSTAIAGIPELIESGVDGLLVPPANAHALADALASLINDAQTRRRIGEAGRQRVARQYNSPLNLELLAQALAQETA